MANVIKSNQSPLSLPPAELDQAHAATDTPVAADTAATKHFFSFDHSQTIDRKEAINPINVSVSNDQIIRSTHVGKLPWSNRGPWKRIPDKAKELHEFPAMPSISLMSIGQLCDAGCEAHFDKSSMTITKDGVPILTGFRSQDTDWLWHVNYEKHQANVGIEVPGSKQRDFVLFHHAALGSPTPGTLIKAIKKGFLKIPGLTVETVQRYLPHTPAMAKGHMNQVQQGEKRANEEPKTDQVVIDYGEDVREPGQ